MGCSGTRVLITRTAEDNPALAALLAARGAVAISFPCIEFSDPADMEPLDRALRCLSGPAAPHWVVLSSPQAVGRLVARLAVLGLSPIESLRSCSLAAVGSGTAEALGVLGLHASLVPDSGAGAAALAKALLPLVRGQRVLLPRAEQGSPVLAAALVAGGAEVLAVAAYRTLPAAASDPDGLRALRDGVVQGILFASGSAVRGFVALLGAEAAALAAKAKVACMGARCAGEARALGLRVDAVAGGAFPELIDALCAALATAPD